MISLLTAFFLYAGDAEWYWWVLWCVIAFHHLCYLWNKNEKF